MGAARPPRLAEEWRISREVLGELLGAPVASAAVPGGSVSDAGGRAVARPAMSISTPRLRAPPGARAHGIRVVGRYTMWATDPPQLAAAIARGARVPRARRWLAWQAKSAAKRVSPRLYESRSSRPGRRRPSARPPSEERRQPRHLSLAGEFAGPDARPPRRSWSLSASSSASCVTAPSAAAPASPGRISSAASPTPAATPPTAVATTGRPVAKASISTCGNPSVQRDVEQHVARAVELEQLVPHRHVAEQLGVLGNSQLAQATRRVRRPGLPRRTTSSRQRGSAACSKGQDVGEQQRVLLLVEPADAQDRAARRRSRVGRRGWSRQRLGDQRHREVEHAPATREYWSRSAPDPPPRRGDTAPRSRQIALEHVGGEVHPAPLRATHAHVARPVLANPEHDRAPPERSQQRQRDRVRIGPEHPERRRPRRGPATSAGASGPATTAPPPGWAGCRSAAAVRARPAVGARSAPASPSGASAADQHQPVDVVKQRGQKQRERPLGVDDAIDPTVDVVGVDGQPASRPTSPASGPEPDHPVFPHRARARE